MPSKVTVTLAVGLAVAALPAGVADAGWEERQVCHLSTLGALVCKTVLVWVPDGPTDTPNPDSGGGDDTPHEESWWDQHCRMVPTGAPPRELSDGTILREYGVACDGFPEIGTMWVADPPPGGPPVPPPDPRDLARRLWASMRVEFPLPYPRIAPADSDPDGYAFVQMPTFFWVDDQRPITRTLTLGPTWVSLTATPVRVNIDTGTGDSITCTQAPPFPTGADPSTFEGCEYVYHDSSAMAPDGATWPVTATVVWTSSWTSSSGAGGTLGEVHMTSHTRPLPVAEIQAVVTDG